MRLASHFILYTHIYTHSDTLLPSTFHLLPKTRHLILTPEVPRGPDPPPVLFCRAHPAATPRPDAVQERKEVDQGKGALSKAKLQKNSLGGRSLIQALFEEFEHGDFIFNYLKDEFECLTHIFFTHPKSVILGRTYQSVFVMDCTYKTNKYVMPLLDIIGMSSFNKSFYAGFCFLLHEKQEDYVWALRMFSNAMGFDDSQPLVIVTDREFALINAIDEVFPRANHLLCVWHIQKNVVAKCKPYFSEQDDWDVFSSMWNSVIYAETEGEFIESWFLFTLVYKHKQEAIIYLENT